MNLIELYTITEAIPLIDIEPSRDEFINGVVARDIGIEVSGIIITFNLYIPISEHINGDFDFNNKIVRDVYFGDVEIPDNYLSFFTEELIKNISI